MKNLELTRPFVCELKPTLMGQQYTIKEECSFVVNPLNYGDYAVYGVAASGRLKEGQAQDGKKDLDDGLFLNGKFVEEGKEVSFEFEMALFDVEFVFGSGTWTEKVNGAVRQKYNVRIKDFRIPEGGSSLTSGVIQKMMELEGSITSSENRVGDLESRVGRAAEEVQELRGSAQEFTNQVGELEDKVSEAEDLESTVSDLVEKLKGEETVFHEDKEKLEKYLAESDKLLESSKDVKDRLDSINEQAEQALSGAITVSLARTFKERKQEAVRLRWIYDVAFVIAIAVAIYISYGIFLDVASVGEGGGALSWPVMLSRVPFLAFFVWLGVFASKKSSVSSRIEEFYAQKQTLAESYEGYRREIDKLSDEEEGKEELVRLMAINLASLSKDSSVIMESASKESHHPLQEAFEKSLSTMFHRKESRSSQEHDQ